MKHSHKHLSDAVLGQLWSRITSNPKSLFAQSPFIRAAVQIVLIQTCLWALLTLVALPDWGSTRFYTFDLRQSPEEIASAGISDVSGYVQTGLELAESGAVSEQNLWRLKMFGPGMTYFYASVIKFFGNDDWFILRVLLISLFSWACLLTSVIRHLIQKHGLTHAILWGLPTVIFAWPSEGMFNTFLLGVDTWALFSLCLGLWLVYRAVQNQDSGSIRALLVSCAGLSLSFAMLLSGRYAFLVNCLAVASVACWLVILSRRHKSQRRTSLWFLSLAIVIALTGTVPWRIHSERFLNPGSYSLRVDAYYWHQRWMPDSYLIENNWGWLEKGGANWACEINAIECRRLYVLETQIRGTNYNGMGMTNEQFRTLALETAFRNPFSYLQNRFSYLFSSWFNFQLPSSPHQRIAQTFGLVALFFSLIRIVMFRVKQFLNPIDLTARIVGGALFVAFLAPFLVFHIEYRYMLPIRFLAIASLPFLFRGNGKAAISPGTRISGDQQYGTSNDLNSEN